MSRKFYETKENLDNERRVADILESKWNCKLKKVSYKLMVDFAICVDELIKGWVEIKCRKISYHYKPLYMISMHKINFARQQARETNTPFVLVVEFTNGIYYWVDKGEKLILKWGGINKKYVRDEQDREPCYYIDLELFKKL